MAASGAGESYKMSKTDSSEPGKDLVGRTERGVKLQQFENPLPLVFFSSADETSIDGHSKYNPRVASFLRDDWIAGQMSVR